MATIRIDAIYVYLLPVTVGAQYLLAVTVTDILAGILTADGYYVETADGLCLVREGG